MRILFTSLCVLFLSFSAQANKEVKDWTILVFLNGHNNLDYYGAEDINEMEKVGSTNSVNVLVQWASMGRETTDRLYVTKDDDTTKVTSKIIENLPRVDMGDYKELVKFVLWGIKNYPARHYFIDVWNHGSGWHYYNFDPTNPVKVKQNLVYTGISFDDFSGNEITTVQLGQAMKDIAEVLKRPIDIYGSDACLMAMPEIAAEMKNYVNYFVGSQDVEPGDGWPYDDFLAGMARFNKVSPEGVVTLLSTAYLNSYQGGSQGTREVTFSAFNLTNNVFSNFEKSMKEFSNAIYTLKQIDKKIVLEAIMKTHVFEYTDYADLVDFLSNLQKKGIDSIELYRTSELLKRATQDLVLVNGVSAYHEKAKGAAIWLPSDATTFNQYWERYQQLDFHKTTGWGFALKSLFN
ncbi:MAG: hypothetical protein IPM57_11430 [Oligoflexia bacterium]|nr:hypothetical protein [Oligoflexia bacterium]